MLKNKLQSTDSYSSCTLSKKDIFRVASDPTGKRTRVVNVVYIALSANVMKFCDMVNAECITLFSSLFDSRNTEVKCVRCWPTRTALICFGTDCTCLCTYSR